MNVIDISIDSVNELFRNRSSETDDTLFDSFIIDVFNYKTEFRPIIMQLVQHFNGEFIYGVDNNNVNSGFAIIWIDGLYFEICCEPRFNLSTLFTITTLLSIRDIIDIDDILEKEPSGAIEDC